MKIAVIEDDISLNRLIVKTLKDNGYDAKAFYDGESILKSKEKFDLYLIDINLPKVGGLDLLDYLSPAVVISAYIKGSIIDTAFKKGAIDYIKKPFVKEELLHKLNKIFPKEIKIKNYTLKPSQRVLISNNTYSILTKNEVNFLMLFKNKDFATLDEIINATGKEGNSLYIFITRLKKKTGIEFENIKGYGYKIKT
ncbi:response regulator transcription factor [Caminibacter pacificus]|uniref:DNA-binding response OmpR family regulator n=1 Tax=Caminibacter pacificus TaxID=1424653 RepID=A0AAJ4UXV0_9BACT|nr:response regulator transcription factor [Caminibacter pacificus]QCI28002.1 response regulator transcription factor [Caminibacter pacificus]ROR39812.1 DNA-binding response OmpR family regulator [Caminibacter pacificus]